MALNIKRADTERKARLVAQRRGVSITEAIDRALENELRLVGGTDAVGAKTAKWLARLAAHGIEPTTESWDWKSEMYDENGLSRW